MTAPFQPSCVSGFIHPALCGLASWQPPTPRVLVGVPARQNAKSPAHAGFESRTSQRRVLRVALHDGPSAGSSTGLRVLFSAVGGGAYFQAGMSFYCLYGTKVGTCPRVGRGRVMIKGWQVQPTWTWFVTLMVSIM